MKKLGLIGGVGPEATLQYYKDIEYGVMERVGEPFFPNMTIESLSCFRMIPLGAAQDYDGMTEYIMGAVRVLEGAGCDFIAMACNTGHMVFDRVQAQCSVPMVSIVEACLEEAQNRGCHKLLLLGTDGTMKDDFFKKPFWREGLEVVVPSEEEQAYVGWHIENELEHGIVKDEVKQEFFRIVRDMAEKEGIEAVILGCTELPMIFDGAETAVPVLDTVPIHIKKIVDMIMEK